MVRDSIDEAERIYRQIRRNGSRLVALTPDGNVAGIPLAEHRASQILRHAPYQVIGVYDDRVEMEWLVDDIDFARRHVGC